MKSRLILLLLITSSYNYSQSTIGNIDFEDGNFNNWTTSIGNTFSSGIPYFFSFDSIGVVNRGDYYKSSHLILDSAAFDTLATSISVICPFTGSKTLRLGAFDRIANLGSRVETSFLVTSTNFKLHAFYSFVADFNPHIATGYPYFIIKVIDTSSGVNQVVDSISFQDPGIPQFTYPIYYQVPWSYKEMNLSTYIGKNLILQITTGNCAYGGSFHEARGYFDFALNNKIEILKDTICYGDSILIGGNYIKTKGLYFDTTYVSGIIDSIFIHDLYLNNNSLLNQKIVIINSNSDCYGDSVIMRCRFNSTIVSDSVNYMWFKNGVFVSNDSLYGLTLISPNTVIGCILTNYMFGCSRVFSDTLVFKVNPNPIVDLEPDGSILKAKVTSGLAPFTYNWKVNFSSLSINDSVISPAINGNYFITVVDSNGCEAKDSIMGYRSGLEELNRELNFNFYPNPATNSIYLELNGEQGIIEIMDTQGKIVQTNRVKSDGELNLENLEKGAYLIRFTSKEGKVITKKLLVD